MLTKISFLIFILLYTMGIASAQTFELIDKVADKIFISLYDNKPVDESSFSELSCLISAASAKDKEDYTAHPEQQVIDSLIFHLSEFKSQIRKITLDSAFVLFNDWFLHLQNVFYKYEKGKYLSSGRPKIILFSTSMSCYCTLKMSREQTADILKLMAENRDGYDCWVIDSYWNNELQIEYNTFFSPSVIILNGKNNLIRTIEYDEEMISRLRVYLESGDEEIEN